VPRVDREGKRWLWALIALGTVVRLAIAAATDGVVYDVESFQLTRHALADDFLHAFGALNGPGFYRWPYPPGFFPWIEVSVAGDRIFGGGYIGFIQLAPIAADAALAWLVAWYLADRNLPRRAWLAAGGLIALGPSFVVISGYAVQIDSVAVLPAVGALIVWERADRSERADRVWKAGLLLGLAASIKTVPGLMVLALLPTARGWREAGALVACAVAVPLVLLAPFAVADLDGVREMLRYSGAPGLGGLTLALQPDLAETWLRTPTDFNGINHWIFEHQRWVNASVLGLTAVFLLRFRVAAPLAAVVLWLAIWAFGTGFFFQYLVWGLPFMLMAGYIRSAAALQLVTIVPAILFYAGPWKADSVVVAFVIVMLAVWLAWLAALVILARAGARGHPTATTA
jgi:hypothetical protein